MRRLRTDQQFERAILSQSAVYVRGRHHRSVDRLGALEAFNPVIVTVAGEKFFRDDHDFLVKS